MRESAQAEVWATPRRGALAEGPVWRGQFETLEVEGRRDGAAGQRPGPETARALPDPLRHQQLRTLTFPQVRAETPGLHRIPVMGQGQLEGRAGVVVPDFRRIDPVPVTDLAGGEQVEDRGARAALAFPGLVSPGLPVPAALRMGLQLQQRDDLLRRQLLHLEAVL